MWGHMFNIGLNKENMKKSSCLKPNIKALLGMYSDPVILLFWDQGMYSL